MTKMNSNQAVTNDQDTTTHLKYSLPNLNHTLQTDVLRIKQSFEQIDEHVHALQTETKQLHTEQNQLQQNLTQQQQQSDQAQQQQHQQLQTTLQTQLTTATQDIKQQQQTLQTQIKQSQTDWRTALAEHIPLGSLHQFINGQAPQDYLRCDGSKYPIASYPALATWLEQFTTEPRAEKATEFCVPHIRSSAIMGTLPLPLPSTLPAPITQAWQATVHSDYLSCGLAVSSSGTVAWTDYTYVTFRTAAGKVTQVQGHNGNNGITDVSYQANLNRFAVSFAGGTMIEYFDDQGQYLGYTAKDNPASPRAIALAAEGTTYVNLGDSDTKAYFVYQGMQTNHLLQGTFPEKTLALMVNEHGLFVLTATGLYRYDAYQTGQTALNQAKALTHGLTDVRDMALVGDELWVITKTGQVVRYDFDLQKKTEQTFSLSGDVVSLGYHPVEQAVYAVTSTGAVCAIPVGTLKSLSLAYYIKSECLEL